MTRSRARCSCARDGLRPGALLGALVGIALGAAGPSARAASIDLAASDLGASQLVGDASGAGRLAADLALFDFEPVRLVVVLEAADLGAPLAWNALLDNRSGALWGVLRVSLEGARLASIGSARANAGGVAAVAAVGETAVRIALAPGEPAGLDLGAPLGSGADWFIDVAGLAVGASFGLVLDPVPVPEPASLALVALGLLALAPQWPATTRSRAR